MILELVPDSAPILRQTQPQIAVADIPTLTETISDLLQTMRVYKAVGLAAPQVGLPLHMFVMEVPDMAARVCINPKVLSVDGAQVGEEGCLSFPDLFLTVERAESVEAEYTDHYGNLVHERFYNLAARCYLHEVDHLNGVRFIEKVSPLSLQMAKGRRRKHLKKAIHK